jgi:hypothetical protein
MRLRFDATRSASASADGVALSQWRPVGERSSRIPDENRRSSAGGAVDREGARTRENGCARGPCRARRPPHVASRGPGSKKGTRNFLLQRIEKAQTWKFSQWPRTGWEQPNEGAEALRSPQDSHAPAAPPSARGGALKGRQRKFSCLQPLEKAQNAEMFSATENGLGATDRERGGSFARRTICMRPRHRHRRARRPEKRHARKFSRLQRIEKARNGKIYSAAEDGLGAISRTAEAL